MKTILYIANARIPTEKAHGVQIMKMCEAFARSGNKVTLVAPWRFNRIKGDPFRYYGIARNFSLVKLPALDLVRFGRVGFLVETVTFCISAFIYVLIKKPDIVYSRDEVVLWPITFLRKDAVWEAHMPRNNYFAHSFARRTGKMIVISNGLKQFFVDVGVSPSNIAVAHDAVDFEQFSVNIKKEEAREALGLPRDESIVMYIGRLDPWKGVETLLQASRMLPENIHVVVIGDGSELVRFRREYPNVIFTGMLPYRDLPRNQRAADILVIPNSGKSEVSRLYTSPLKVFAHMMSGVPLIASDLPSIRETLHERNAILVPPDDAHALADAIKKVVADADTASVLAARAAEDVKRYTWDERAGNIIEFLHNNQ